MDCRGKCVSFSSPSNFCPPPKASLPVHHETDACFSRLSLYRISGQETYVLIDLSNEFLQQRRWWQRKNACLLDSENFRSDHSVARIGMSGGWWRCDSEMCDCSDKEKRWQFHSAWLLGRYQLCGCDQKALIAHAKLTDGGSLEARMDFWSCYSGVGKFLCFKLPVDLTKL